MSADLIRQKARERHFLEQLLDSRKLENYDIPVPINAELRKYQQVGPTRTPRSVTFPPLLASITLWKVCALHPLRDCFPCQLLNDLYNSLPLVNG